MIAKAHVYLEKMIENPNLGSSGVANLFGVDRADVGRVLPLAFMAPRLLDQILTGRQSDKVSTRNLARRNCPFSGPSRSLRCPELCQEQQHPASDATPMTITPFGASFDDHRNHHARMARMHRPSFSQTCGQRGPRRETLKPKLQEIRRIAGLSTRAAESPSAKPRECR